MHPIVTQKPRFLPMSGIIGNDEKISPDAGNYSFMGTDGAKGNPDENPAAEDGLLFGLAERDRRDNAVVSSGGSRK
jgi:hypothetical protein